MEGIQEIGTVFGAEFRRAIRSGRVVVLLALYSMFSLLTLFAVGWVANGIRSQVEAKIERDGGDTHAAEQLATEARKPILGLLFSDDEVWIEAVKEVPMVVLVVFKLALLFLPLYVALMGFDQMSGEVGPRSIRYLTIRARRSSIMFGKFLSQAALLLALVLVVDTWVFIYARVSDPDFRTSVMLATLVRFWLASIVFSLAYLGLTTCCSALFRSSPVSLVFNFVMLFVFWMIDAIGAHFVARVPGLLDEGPKEIASPASYIRFLSPSHYASDLLHPHLSHYGVATLAYLGFAVVFLAASYGVLRVRDL